MSALAVFKVTNAMAARLAVSPGIKTLAGSIMSEAAEKSPRGPTGDMAGGWRLTQGLDPATTFVSNAVPHASYVEYGTRNMPARPVLGPILAHWRSQVGARRRRSH